MQRSLGLLKVGLVLEPETAYETRGQVEQSSATEVGTVLSGALLAVPLTVYSVLIQGYHPFSEDGGLYLAGVRYLLDPTLYGQSRAFVTAHLKYSVFAPVMAGLVHGSGRPFAVVVLAVHVLCLWVTILAVFLVACAVFRRTTERCGATVLFAAWMGLPVAGTSLTIADPYLTARCFSLPCVLLALAAALRWRELLPGSREARRMVLLSGVALVCGAAMHPLMAGYGAVVVGTYFALEADPGAPRWVRWVLGVLAAVGACAVVERVAQAESTAWRMASLTRSYWFPARWAWYEMAGLVLPLALLAVLAMRGRTEPQRVLARTSLAAGGGVLVVALVFAHPDSRSLVISRMQPLRLFQVVYVGMTVLLGGAMGRWLGGRQAWWAAAVLLLGVGMTVPAHELYRGSAHLELPSQDDARVRENAWSAAFLWARDHTPKDALFALDADYISRAGEDGEAFRALAERSALPDYSKDGGESAITASLAEAWRAGVEAQRGLSGLTATQRRERLRPLGVTWMVLESGAPVDAGCGFDDGVVKVCPLR